MKPRKWQKDALDIWKKDKRGIVKVVTGGGKTIFACLCIDYLRKSNLENFQVVIFVPSLMLLDQWEVEVSHFFKNEVSISTCSGSSKPDYESQVIISTLDSGKKLRKNLRKRENIFCIVDECHRAGSEKRSESIRYDWGFTLGLSATPEREHDDAFEEVLVPFLGSVIYVYDYKSALRDGVISSFDLINIYVPLISEEEDDYKKMTKRISKRIAVLGKFDKYDDYLKMLLIKRARILNDAYLRAPTVNQIINLNDSKKWLIFCEQILQAEVVNELIDRKGLRVSTYHTGLSKIERSDKLSMFKDGVLDVLVSCKSLDEGFDVPDAESAIIVSSSSSIRQRIQRMGRVLRKTDDTKNAKIYTLYSSDVEKERLMKESARFNYEVNVYWKTLKANV